MLCFLYRKLSSSRVCLLEAEWREKEVFLITSLEASQKLISFRRITPLKKAGHLTTMVALWISKSQGSSASSKNSLRMKSAMKLSSKMLSVGKESKSKPSHKDSM